MEKLPAEEELPEDSALEIFDKVYEEMKNLLASAETLLQLDPDESISKPPSTLLDGPATEEAC